MKTNRERWIDAAIAVSAYKDLEGAELVMQVHCDTGVPIHLLEEAFSRSNSWTYLNDNRALTEYLNS